MIAIETDRVLAAQLRMNFSLTPNIEVIEGDILAVDFDTIFGPRPAAPVPAWSAFRSECASSETFHISSPRISAPAIPLQALLRIDRLDGAEGSCGAIGCSATGSKDYGLLSATTQLYASIEELFTVPPEAFVPPPKVHSAGGSTRRPSRDWKNSEWMRPTSSGS